MSLEFLHILVLTMSMNASLIAYFRHTCLPHNYKKQGNCRLAQNVQFSSSTAFFLSTAVLRRCFTGDQQIEK